MSAPVLVSLSRFRGLSYTTEVVVAHKTERWLNDLSIFFLSMLQQSGFIFLGDSYNASIVYRQMRCNTTVKIILKLWIQSGYDEGNLL